MSGGLMSVAGLRDKGKDLKLGVQYRLVPDDIVEQPQPHGVQRYRGEVIRCQNLDVRNLFALFPQNFNQGLVLTPV
ncbi:hypothetical protein P8C59_006895 [Phyllachora maydis]|uniref:Uncharacterized protein n=1 Tax=Phyllachora maydis TaxID=1825666 RepID=A0AAD9I7D7_9PEZI|nr:hypothetical protein P8C59_006895 [Phyllachora maydis]